MPRFLVNNELLLLPNRSRVEGLIRLPFVVTLDFDRDSRCRLAGGEGQRAGLGDVIALSASIKNAGGRAFAGHRSPRLKGFATGLLHRVPPDSLDRQEDAIEDADLAGADFQICLWTQGFM